MQYVKSCLEQGRLLIPNKTQNDRTYLFNIVKKRNQGLIALFKIFWPQFHTQNQLQLNSAYSGEVRSEVKTWMKPATFNTLHKIHLYLFTYHEMANRLIDFNADVTFLHEILKKLDYAHQLRQVFACNCLNFLVFSFNWT